MSLSIAFQKIICYNNYRKLGDNPSEETIMKIKNLALETLLKRNKHMLVSYLFNVVDYKTISVVKYVKKEKVYVGIIPDRDVPYRYQKQYEDKVVPANKGDKGAYSQTVEKVLTYSEYLEELIKENKGTQKNIARLMEDFKNQVPGEVIEKLTEFSYFLNIDFEEYQNYLIKAIEHMKQMKLTKDK